MQEMYSRSKRHDNHLYFNWSNDKLPSCLTHGQMPGDIPRRGQLQIHARPGCAIDYRFNSSPEVGKKNFDLKPDPRFYIPAGESQIAINEKN